MPQAERFLTDLSRLLHKEGQEGSYYTVEVVGVDGPLLESRRYFSWLTNALLGPAFAS
jgi:hypothetical protein